MGKTERKKMEEVKLGNDGHREATSNKTKKKKKREKKREKRTNEGKGRKGRKREGKKNRRRRDWNGWTESQHVEKSEERGKQNAQSELT